MDSGFERLDPFLLSGKGMAMCFLVLVFLFLVNIQDWPICPYAGYCCADACIEVKEATSEMEMGLALRSGNWDVK